MAAVAAAAVLLLRVRTVARENLKISGTRREYYKIYVFFLKLFAKNLVNYSTTFYLVNFLNAYLNISLNKPV